VGKSILPPHVSGFQPPNLVAARCQGRCLWLVWCFTGRSIAGLKGRNFAVVWFSDILAAGAPSTASIGANWGIICGSDWTLPGGDIGSYPINSTDSCGTGSYYQVNALNGGSPATAFRTTTNGIIGCASFVIVPEPTAGLLCVLGVLGPLRRRRI